MFGFGISEIITLAVVIIILVNPKDLPVIVRRLGRIYASIMKQMNGVRKSFSKFEEEIRMATDFSEELEPLNKSSRKNTGPFHSGNKLKKR